MAEEKDVEENKQILKKRKEENENEERNWKEEEGNDGSKNRWRRGRSVRRGGRSSNRKRSTCNLNNPWPPVVEIFANRHAMLIDNLGHALPGNPHHKGWHLCHIRLQGRPRYFLWWTPNSRTMHNSSKDCSNVSKVRLAGGGHRFIGQVLSGQWMLSYY